MDRGLREARHETHGSQAVVVYPLADSKADLRKHFPDLAGAPELVLSHYLAALLVKSGTLDEKVFWYGEFLLVGPDALIAVASERSQARIAEALNKLPLPTESTVRASAHFLALPDLEVAPPGVGDSGSLPTTDSPKRLHVVFGKPDHNSTDSLESSRVVLVKPDGSPTTLPGVGRLAKVSRRAPPGRAIDLRYEEAVPEGSCDEEKPQGVWVRARVLPLPGAEFVALTVSARAVNVALQAEDSGWTSVGLPWTEPAFRVLDRGEAYLLTSTRHAWRGTGDDADLDDRRTIGVVLRFDSATGS